MATGMIIPIVFTINIKLHPFGQLLTYGISKFSTEYNGVVLRGVNQQLEPFHVTYGLRKMKGGVDAHDTADDIIKVRVEYYPVPDHALATVISMLDELEEKGDDTIRPTPPLYLKLGKILHIDVAKQEIHVELHKNMPIANTGDGVGVNIKAVCVLQELYGIKAPGFRCAAHVASGVVRRAITSKTMNVPELTTLYETIRTIVKHFESSIKNKETLDQAMENLELTPIHIMSWCQTRMVHFLTVCKVLNDSLAGVYDVMATMGVRPEERDLLFTAQNVFLVKIISCLEPTFMESFMRPIDRTSLLVTEVFAIGEKIVSKITDHDTTGADEFLDSLRFDNHGNMLGSLKIKGNKHDIQLSHHSKPSRQHQRDEQLQQVKNKLLQLKTSVIIFNIEDQNSESSWYWNWSALDFTLSLGLSARLNRLREVIRIYTTEYVHIKQQYATAKEDRTIDHSYENYAVNLHHQKTIDCSEEELTQQFKAAWTVLNSLWMSESNLARSQNRKPSQLAVWQKLQSEHFLEFPSFVQLIQVMVCTPNTSPLERSFTKLQLVAAKRRNHFLPQNLET